MPKPRTLSNSFVPISYELDTSSQPLGLVIAGKKVGRPSKRITLHQKGLKIVEAHIWKLDKKDAVKIPVTRINHHANFEEVRLHTDSVLFPGQYKVKLGFHLPELALGNLKSIQMSRNILPMVDEPGVVREVKIREV